MLVPPSVSRVLARKIDLLVDPTELLFAALLSLIEHLCASVFFTDPGGDVFLSTVAKS